MRNIVLAPFSSLALSMPAKATEKKTDLAMRIMKRPDIELDLPARTYHRNAILRPKKVDPFGCYKWGCVRLPGYDLERSTIDDVKDRFSMKRSNAFLDLELMTVHCHFTWRTYSIGGNI